jgi:hypothetical protein
MKPGIEGEFLLRSAGSLAESLHIEAHTATNVHPKIERP